MPIDFTSCFFDPSIHEAFDFRRNKEGRNHREMEMTRANVSEVDALSK